jgi:V/A-type H+-transporting ATPase subunit K
MKPSRTLLGVLAAGGVAVALGSLLVLGLIARALAAESPAATGAVALDPDVVRWGLLAAALSVGASAVAAGYAVARVGTAAVGAIAEKPELMGRVLILVGLAEGIAIYGLIVAILILNRLG